MGRLFERDGVTRFPEDMTVRATYWAAAEIEREVQEAADTIKALTARIAQLEAERDAARENALEEAAKVAVGFHERALDWAKNVRGLTEYIGETDSSRIAATIRALKDTRHD